MKIETKQKLKVWMKRRYSFRVHMSLIMLSTIGLGLCSNFILINTFGILHPAIRYPLTIVITYFWFLGLIRIYISAMLSNSENDISDYVDVVPDINPQGSISGTYRPEWTGHGGKFSGGGSSGNWSNGEVIGSTKNNSFLESAAEGGVEAITDNEAGAIVVLVIGGILAVVIFGSGAYFIWHSPEILSECLLQVILVSGLTKKLKRLPESEWITHIFKSTIWPFIGVMILSGVLGLSLRKVCPNANGVWDYRTQCWGFEINE